MKHLSEKQLLAFRDGEADDPRIREHLATCEKCQKSFDDSRWSLSLRRLMAARGEGHPSSEELTAFWDNALSGGAARRIQRHLRSCDRCLAVYRRMRGVPRARAYASPPPELVRRVRQRFASRPRGFDLGELWLRWIGGAPELTRAPVEEGVFDLSASVLEADLHQAMAEAPHPASAGARKQRLARAVGREPGKPFHLEAGSLRLELRVAGSDDERAALEVRLLEADTNEPARQVPVRVISDEDGVVAGARTDGQGCARLDLPDGSCRLEILTGTPITLRLNKEL